MSNWTIIYTYNNQSSRPIHLRSIIENNPEAQVILAEMFPTSDKNFSWRNCDKFIRNWLKKNIGLIKNNHVALVEWDVLVLKSLPQIEIKNKIYCKDPKFKLDDWHWFKDISVGGPTRLDRLKNFKEHRAGIPVFGFLMMDKICLDFWIDPEFDDLYDQDIFCELRLGTILNYKKVKIDSYSLPNIKWQPWRACTDFTKPDFYHPVKQKIVKSPMD